MTVCQKLRTVVGDADRMDQMVRVTVVEVIRGKVRLGFEAAAGVAVHRAEVWERIVATGGPAVEPASPQTPFA